MRGVGTVSFRAGPFAGEGRLIVNGKEIPGKTESHGDATWIRAELPYKTFEI